MSTSGKLCLQWDDFKDHAGDTLRDLWLDSDFSDVTLVGEDCQQIAAHKIILMASSTILRKLLLHSKHPHPLLYMRGINSKDLAAVLEFMYQGQVSIGKEDVNRFLGVASELGIKGLKESSWDKENILSETELFEFKSEHIENPVLLDQSKFHDSHPINSAYEDKNDFIDKPEEVLSNEMITEALESIDPIFKIVADEPTPDNLFLFDLPIQNVTEDLKQTVISSNEENSLQENHINVSKNIELEEIILLMMEKIGDEWSCKSCEKGHKSKQHIRDHIEDYHLNGGSYPCKLCGKINKTRISSRRHIRNNRCKKIDFASAKLDEQINAILEKVDNGWKCNICQHKDHKNKDHVKEHIESRHIEGWSHSCNMCGKTLKTRACLRQHTQRNQCKKQ